MAGKPMPRRDNTARRRQPSRDKPRTILVYCGALRTEPAYFNALRRDTRRRNVTVKIRQDGTAPHALVKAAAAYRDRGPADFDEVWCVVDTDEFDVAAAADVAAKHRVNLAVSNPCFELWLLLHHTDCRGSCDGCSDVQRRLRHFVPDYDKARLDFNRFAPGVNHAVMRAKKLEPTGTTYGKTPPAESGG